MFGWIKKASKGNIELALERLEDFIVEHGPLRRSAVALYALWTSGQLKNPLFQQFFFHGNGDVSAGSALLSSLEQVRHQNVQLAECMKRVNKSWEMPADELGSYAAIRATALDLVCLTVGAVMRRDLQDRARSVWHAFLTSEQPDAVLEEIVQWFRSEANLLAELGGADPVIDMKLDDMRLGKLPWLARS